MQYRVSVKAEGVVRIEIVRRLLGGLFGVDALTGPWKEKSNDLKEWQDPLLIKLER